ncbi:helix-turn-helix domain-containing protein [Viridibacillus sp. FSL R5-0888]|uniref:helix-turn-helix domain-containing protein n=1 Tax=Viridibacillus sp. FSL R5-0888 TaxID=2921663 RepID=UPI0030F4CC5A
MNSNTQTNKNDFYISKETIITAIKEGLSSNKEWMSLAEAAKYAGVSHNTFTKFREMGLKICQVEGIKRVSRKEIDNFLETHSF